MDQLHEAVEENRSLRKEQDERYAKKIKENKGYLHLITKQNKEYNEILKEIHKLQAEGKNCEILNQFRFQVRMWLACDNTMLLIHVLSELKVSSMHVQMCVCGLSCCSFGHVIDTACYYYHLGLHSSRIQSHLAHDLEAHLCAPSEGRFAGWNFCYGV